jgi:hypothetical protein
VPLLAVAVVVFVARTVNGIAGFGFALVTTLALAPAINPATAVVFVIVPILAVNPRLAGELPGREVDTCRRRWRESPARYRLAVISGSFHAPASCSKPFPGY